MFLRPAELAHGLTTGPTGLLSGGADWQEWSRLSNNEFYSGMQQSLVLVLQRFGPFMKKTNLIKISGQASY